MKVTSMKIFLKMKDLCLKDLGPHHQMNTPRLARSLVTCTRVWTPQVCQVMSELLKHVTRHSSSVTGNTNRCQYCQIVWRMTKPVTVQHVGENYIEFIICIGMTLFSCFRIWTTKQQAHHPSSQSQSRLSIRDLPSPDRRELLKLYTEQWWHWPCRGSWQWRPDHSWQCGKLSNICHQWLFPGNSHNLSKVALNIDL